MKKVVTIGGFASLHNGHRELIGKSVEMAREKGLKCCVFTFDTGLDSHKGTATFMTAEQKEEALVKMGVDEVVVQQFDEAFRGISPESFVKDVLAARMNAGCVVVGENFRFGKNASGTAQTLKTLCEKAGMECVIQPLKKDDTGNVISTSYIEELAKAGDTERLKKALGRPLKLKGKVIHGRHDGTKIGFPTVNVKVSENAVVPAKGVYISETSVDGKSYVSITNIGNAPTFESHDELTETHIIGVSENLYGRVVEISLHKKLRNITKFGSVEELKKQLESDTAEAVKYWENIK